MEGRRTAARGGAETKVSPGARREDSKRALPQTRDLHPALTCEAREPTRGSALRLLARGRPPLAGPAPRRPRPHSFQARLPKATPPPLPPPGLGMLLVVQDRDRQGGGGRWRQSAPRTRPLLRSQFGVL